MFDHTTYNRERARRRKDEWLAANGPCRRCGTWDDLEVDHVDPKTKSFSVTFTEGKARLEAELAKCQVLCVPCHIQKAIETGEHRGGGQNKITNPQHGTDVMYRREKCRCPECQAWKRRSNQEWRQRKSRR
jgi:hypothetical protein